MDIMDLIGEATEYGKNLPLRKGSLRAGVKA